MNFEYVLHLYCSRNHFGHYERLRETDFHVFTRDTIFSGIREGVLTNGGSYTFRILPVINDGDNRWIMDDTEWPPAVGRRLHGFEIVVEDNTEVYSKRYPLTQFTSRALEKARSATSNSDSLLSCGTLQYFIIAMRKTVGTRSEGRTRTGTTESRIRVHAPSESMMGFENGSMPDVIPDCENIASHARISLQKDFPVYVKRATLERIRQCARMNLDREVAGFLLGRVLQDISSEIFMVVDDQIEALHTEASLTKITITSRSWTAFWEELKRRNSDRQLVGWWHSHPFDASQVSRRGEAPCREMDNYSPGFSTRDDMNEEPHSSVFLSAQDIFIHTHFFSWPYQIALVVDPALEFNYGMGVWGWRDGVVKMRTAYVLSQEVEI